VCDALRRGLRTPETLCVPDVRSHAERGNESYSVRIMLAGKTGDVGLYKKRDHDLRGDANMSATGASLVRYLRTLAAGRANDAFTDRQLLEQFVTRREEPAFAALVRRHGPMVLSVCRRVLRHDQDAEDAFQATFLVLAKKAGSLRKHESLGSWLHGVAYHIAARLRAKEVRRVVHERNAARRPAIDPGEDVAWREIRCLLDSELARLPEQYRGPLVLCYLQGKTQDEAARQLEWSLRTFRRRLKDARDLLVRRLTHRGVTLSAALTAPLLADATQAALPPLLTASTVRASMATALENTVCSIVSAQVAALAESGVGSLLTKKVGVAAVLLVSLMLGLGGLLAHRAMQDGTFAVAPAAPKAPPATPAPPPPARSASNDKTLSIKGRVLDPDGKPLAGAKVYVTTYAYKDKRDPKVRVTTDADGRFHFPVSREEVDRGESIVAIAPDYGPDWIALKEIRDGNELTLRLVKDDVPINGRVLDPDGEPLASARLLLPSDAAAKKTDIPVRATTDKDGRFRFQAKPPDFDPQGKATLAAVAKGFGPDWIEITAEDEGDIALRLVKDDVPIGGRVLDLEGQPISGVRVHVVSLHRGDLNAWIKVILTYNGPLPEGKSSEMLGASASAVTGLTRKLGSPCRGMCNTWP
jgi:RNA polymerase sigma factor (sigma-70 family)